MSTLSDIYNELTSILFTSTCFGCGSVMEGRNSVICTRCRMMIPSTGFHLKAQNPMSDKVRSLMPQIVNASAQFYHIDNGCWRNIIHQIKYQRMWHLATTLGYWYGSELKESPLYQDIDCIVPIPLHPSKLIRRGYNQCQKIGEGISNAMGIELESRAVVRIKNNSSQVTHNREQRWVNVSGIFHVRKPERLKDRHILLVDDVFTTGATMLSCAEEILKAVPSCRISMVTLSISSRYMPVNL